MENTAYERFLDVAFTFKKEKPWRCICSDDLYAVRLPGETERVVFCSLSGKYKTFIGLSVYETLEAYMGVRQMIQNEDHDMLNGVAQDCIQCTLDNRDLVADEEYDLIRAYADERGMLLRGANAFPHAVRIHPWGLPTPILDDEETMETLTFCVKATTGRVKEVSSRVVALGKAGKMPLIEWNGTAFCVGEMDIPEMLPRDLPSPQVLTAKDLKRLKSFPKKGICQYDAMIFPFPLRDDGSPDSAMHMIGISLICDAKGEWVQPLDLIRSYDRETADALVNNLIDLFLHMEQLPRQIQVRNERAIALLEPTCRKLGIVLQRVTELEELDRRFEEMVLQFLNDNADLDDDEYDDDDESSWLVSPENGKMDMQTFLAVVSYCNEASDDELRQMPREIKQVVLMAAEENVFPSELKKRLLRVLL